MKTIESRLTPEKIVELKHETLLWTEEASGSKSNESSCTKCQNMCTKAPCLATPIDVISLIQDGHADKLCRTKWGAGLGHNLPIIDMIQLRFENGKCVMFQDGKCTIHETKPLEGKLADCKRTHVEADKIPPAYAIALMWNHETFKKLNDIAFNMYEGAMFSGLLSSAITELNKLSK